MAEPDELTRVLHSGTNAQFDTKLGASTDSQDISTTGRREGALVAADIGAIGVRVVANVGSGVRRELDGVVPSRPGEVADILERSRGLAAGGDDVKEVVSGGQVGGSKENSDGELHLEGNLEGTLGAG